MGVTAHSIDLIQKAIALNVKAESVIELGSQNLYDQSYSGKTPYASIYYITKGLRYACIDLNGENEALKLDLENPIDHKKKYDIVTDFGTSEHIRNYYSVWKTKHDLCKLGGVIISENPKTGNWKGHGFNYPTIDFYTELAQAMGYKIHYIGEHPAMGNSIDGWNVYSIMTKEINNNFLFKAEFQKLKFYDK